MLAAHRGCGLSPRSAGESNRRVALTWLPLAVLAAVIALLLPLTATAAPGDTTADRVYGQGGSFTSGDCNLIASPDTTLCNPWGVLLDTGGRLFIADTNNDRVLIYNSPLSSSIATQIINVGAGGQPLGIALDSTGRLYVAVSLSRVLQYDTPLASTVLTRTINLPPGAYPIGVATDAAGRLYVADSYIPRILILQNPTVSDTATVVPTGSGSIPTGIALDASGRVFLTDQGSHRVVWYDSILTDSTPDGVIGQPGFAPGTCNNGGLDAGSICFPAGVAAGADGSIYVSDSNNNRALQYNSPFGGCGSCDLNADTVYGQPSATVGTCNNGGRSANTLCSSRGIAVSPNGSVWVTDGNNNRVLQYDGQGCSASPEASGTVGPGGTVTTDPSGAGATPCQEVQASVKTLSGGSITVKVEQSQFSPYIGKQVQITAPSGTPNSPLSVTFDVDASLLGPGQDLSTIQVFRNGVRVWDCSSPPGIAGPDPCVSSKSTTPGSDLRFTVLTSGASIWNFGPYTPVGGSVVLPTDGPGGEHSTWVWALALGVASLSLVYIGWRRRRVAVTSA